MRTNKRNRCERNASRRNSYAEETSRVHSFLLIFDSTRWPSLYRHQLSGSGVFGVSSRSEASHVLAILPRCKSDHGPLEKANKYCLGSPNGVTAARRCKGGNLNGVLRVKPPKYKPCSKRGTSVAIVPYTCTPEK
jgi:hypothetical protein